jgi:tetratricopeptide (TPR) repeat protein
MVPGEEVIKQVSELRKQARFMDAWELLKPFDPPENWTNPEHQGVATRLIESLGGSLRGQKIWFRLWRHKETRHVAREDMVWEVLEKRGAFLTWQWLEKHPPFENEDEDNKRDHAGIQAYLLGRLRDFERAESCLARLLKATEECAWAYSIQCDLLSWQDRHEEALAAAARSLELRPTLISAILSQHDELLKLGRDEEALAKLTKSAAELQSGALLRRLALLQIELDHREEALETLNRHEQMMPLMEKDMRCWQAGRRCDLASAMGDHDEALRQSRLAAEGSGFYKKVAEYLDKATGTLTRRILPVGFVAQHHLTCAPATVSAVAAFLGKEVGHLDLADEICYDGTPDYRERAWAETHGWAVREFRVTVDAAKQLIDRGIPVILSMVYPNSAHAQAVIGYDELRQVLFVRDPSYRTMTEFLALEALEEQRPFGPRGLAMVPKEQESRFDGLDLPDTALYDLKHAFDSALEKHERAAAVVILEQMRRDHPNERLRWFVELALARYDNNTQARLDGLEALLKMFPDVVNWQMDRLNAVRELQGRETFTQELRAACEKKDAHPLLWRMLGRELHWEAKHVDEARRWLRRFHRDRVDSIAVLTSANMLWDTRRWEEATALYRIASCLDDKIEGLTMSYFKAARWVRRTDEALAMLRRRFDRDGQLSSQPALSLYEALDMLDLGEDALAVLEQARKKRPDDAELGLFLVRALIRTGNITRTRQMLSEVKGVASPAAWQRCQAQIARHEADNHQELASWRAVLESEPLAVDAHRAIARLLEHLEGREPALRHLRETCARFPFHWQLHDALLDWVREDGPTAIEPAVREMLRIDPRSAWAWRELAVVMRQQKRFDEAHAALEHSLANEPLNPWHFNVLGTLLEQEQRLPEARKAFRHSITLDADITPPMRSLLALCHTQPERLAELNFIQGEITRQVTRGDGVLEFAEIARPYLGMEEIEVFLREGHRQRPDLWQTGATLAMHLRSHDRVDEAIAIMTDVCGRFPLLPRVWLELGECFGAKPDREKQIEALGKVREMNPSWGWGMRIVATALKKAARYPEALKVMQQALRHSPSDAWNLGWVAELQWHLGRKTEAMDHLQKAVELDPGYNWAWSSLRDWGAQTEHADAAKNAAQKLTRERPAEARSWLILADMLTEPGEFPEQLAALDHAIAAAPRSVAGYEEKARLLALAGRFEEAFAVCEAHPDPVKPPLLIAREAWVLWRKHERKTAVSRMQSALAADPGLLWGWKQIVEWHQELEDLAAAEDAVVRVSQLEPDEPVHLGMLAEIREKRRDETGCVAALERALSIAPDYAFALRKLVDHHCRRGRHAEARKLLEDSRPHHPPIEYLSRLFGWHWRQKQHAEAGQVLMRMIAEPEALEHSYTRVLEEMKQYPAHGSLKRIAKSLADTIRKGEARNSHAGHFYVNLAHHLEQVPRWEVIQHIPSSDAGGEAMMISYIEGIGERWSRLRDGSFGEITSWRESRRLDRLVRERREMLRANNELWGAIGYSLHSMKRSRDTAAWLADWRERPDAEPYMLNNLFFSLQNLGREDEARAVLNRGMELPRHNEVTMRFHIHAALEDLLACRTEDARRHLAVVHEPELGTYSKNTLRLTQEMLAYQPGCPQYSFDAGASAAVAAFLGSNPKNRTAIKLAWRACQLASRHNRSLQPRIWWMLHRHSRKLGVLIAILLLTASKIATR